jgi:hypothetical protein
VLFPSGLPCVCIVPNGPSIPPNTKSIAETMVADKEHLADYRATTDKSWDMREMLIEDVADISYLSHFCIFVFISLEGIS